MKLTTAIVVLTVLTGCSSSMREVYYLQAHDPVVGYSNYFKVEISGRACLSRAKYSVGFYDKDAVERLFGENELQREYLATSVDVFDPATGKRLTDLSSELDSAAAATTVFDKRRLENASATVAGLIERMDVQMTARPKLRGSFETALDTARLSQQAAEDLLSNGDLAGAAAAVRKAQLILEAVRIAAEGHLLVRFFDGAGNEIDVSRKTLVIFVATDASRFAEALRQLAQADEAANDILLAVLGPRLQEAEYIAQQVASANVELGATKEQIEAMIADAPDVPTTIENGEGDTVDIPAGHGDLISARAELDAFVLEIGATIAGRTLRFSGPDEMKAFGKAMAEVSP